jgi:hypothetical protein
MNFKLKQLSILLRIAGNIIQFVLLAEATKASTRGIRSLNER